MGNRMIDFTDCEICNYADLECYSSLPDCICRACASRPDKTERIISFEEGVTARKCEDHCSICAESVGFSDDDAPAKSRSSATATPDANKDDLHKVCRPGLIAPELTYGIGVVLAYGATKYSAGNWARGMAWSRAIDALDRHWLAWKSGEAKDEETGYSHLWHVGCCLMFLVAYEARRIGRDDRIETGLAAPDANPGSVPLT